MSIGMEHFASQGHFLTYDPFGNTPKRTVIFQVQCRSCGFEPDDVVTPPRICPKCHGESWERYAKPGSILVNADRY